MRLVLLVLAILGTGWLSQADVRGCSIPVFRYALERWKPDAYEAVLFHRGPPSPELQALAKQITAAATALQGPANIQSVLVDLDLEGDTPRRKLWEMQKDATLPWIVVCYPGSSGKNQPAWAAPAVEHVVERVLRSPARQEVVRRLLRGDSIVWVLIETGNKAQDDAAIARLTSSLRKLERSLKLPTDEDINKDGGLDLQLLSDLPLKLSFSTLRVARSDPSEKVFLAMLINYDDDAVKRTNEPLMFPIFGRGRALDVFIGSGINDDTISDAASLLSAACSCTVKRLNPGFDVLFTADWDVLLEGKEKPSPEPTIQPGKPVAIPPGLAPAAVPSPPETPVGQAAAQMAVSKSRDEPGRSHEVGSFAAYAAGFVLFILVVLALKRRLGGPAA